MKRSIRIAAAIMLLAIAAGPLYLVFAAIRIVSAGLPTRVIIFPTDFVGTAVVVEDPVNGTELKTRGFWHRETTIPIPTSGLLAVRSLEPFYWMTTEKVTLADGTILDGTSPWGRRPSRFRRSQEPKAIKRLLASCQNPNQLKTCAFDLAPDERFNPPEQRTQQDK